MAYKNILSSKKCNGCYSRDFCFLRQMPLHNYPKSTQNVFIDLLNNAFYFNTVENRWHTNHQDILKQILAYYNAQYNIIHENLQPFLSVEAQRECDRQFIENKFKQLLDVAAKATEKTAPEISIVFEGIGLVLASDYLEAVHKVLSMFQKCTDTVNQSKDDCKYFSANPDN